MNREKWLDSYGEHVVLPITVVDNRKNRFRARYQLRVISKGKILVEKVGREDYELSGANMTYE